MDSRTALRSKRLRLFLALVVLACFGAAGGLFWTARYMRSPQFKEELGLIVQHATGRTVSIDSRRHAGKKNSESGAAA